VETFKTRPKSETNQSILNHFEPALAILEDF